MSENISRPFSVTIFIWLVLIIAARNFIRSYRSVLQWDFLLDVVNVHPAYLVISGAVWSLCGIILAWGLLRGQKWAYYAARWGAAVYILYLWLDRLFIRDPSVRNTNFLFSISITVVLFLWILWVFSKLDVRIYYGVMDE